MRGKGNSGGVACAEVVFKVEGKGEGTVKSTAGGTGARGRVGGCKAMARTKTTSRVCARG